MLGNWHPDRRHSAEKSLRARRPVLAAQGAKAVVALVHIVRPALEHVAGDAEVSIVVVDLELADFVRAQAALAGGGESLWLAATQESLLHRSG